MKKNRCGKAIELTIEIEQKVLDVMVGRYGLRDRAMFIFGLYTGMRRNEIRLLNIGDVFNRDGTIKDEFTLHPTMTKEYKERTIYIHDKIKRSLKAYIDERLNTGGPIPLRQPLFISQYDERIGLSTFSRVFEEAFERANIEGASTHSMRHTFITRLHRAGGRIKDIAELVGHANVASTHTYINVTRRDIKETLRLLDRV